MTKPMARSQPRKEGSPGAMAAEEEARKKVGHTIRVLLVVSMLVCMGIQWKSGGV